jgi:hypothetical protein
VDRGGPGQGRGVHRQSGALATPALYRNGESGLLQRDGMWFLNATCEVPEAPLNPDPVDFLGIDLGIVNIATTSDGDIMV